MMLQWKLWFEEAIVCTKMNEKILEERESSRRYVTFIIYNT